MILDLIAIVAFAIVLFMVIAFIYFRDRGILARLEAYEQAIDDLNDRVYLLEKHQPESPEAIIEDFKRFQRELKKVEKELHARLDSLGDPILKTIRAVKEMETELERINQSINERIDKIEQTTKISPMSGAHDNEKRIMELYADGLSPEEIAKKERLPLGEVELILRIANLR